MSSQQVVLQIGDLHYPDFVDLKTGVDTHDRNPPGAIENQLDLPLPGALKRELREQLRRHPDAVVAICGDITSRGDAAQFESGIQYLADIVRGPAVNPPISDDRIHIVPGNHDVAYKGAAPFVDFADTARFEELARIAEQAGFPGLFTVTSRATRITNPNGGAISLMSVNTCRGAGATRKDATRRGREAGYVGDSVDAEGPHHSDEVLDVPLMHPVELSAISSQWSTLDRQTLPILLAHHGLLPQHTPRLNPYTEMVNAGQVRKALANLNRSVIYLHGHIHEHVVEIVDSPKSSDTGATHDRTVVIAAPELRDGFNKIIVEFNDGGEAVGVIVEQYRIRQGEQSVHKEPNDVRVTLVGTNISNESQRLVFGLLAARRLADGAELLRHGASASPAVSAVEMRSAVETLVWSGAIKKVSGNESNFERSGFAI